MAEPLAGTELGQTSIPDTARIPLTAERSPSIAWGIITPEHPPEHGGVSDYTAQLARALVAAGDRATVWFPGDTRVEATSAELVLRPLRHGFGLDGRRTLERELDALPPNARILVQFAPHGFGYRGLNLPLARLISRLHPRPVDAMFHEVAFPSLPGASIRHRILSNVQFRMARTIAERADRVFVSTRAWGKLLENSLRNADTITWLPVPSNLPTSIPRAQSDAARSQVASTGQFVIGHFSTYGAGVLRYLDLALPALLVADPRRICVLMGRGAQAARDEAIRRNPALATRLTAVGDLAAIDLARLISACDAMLQPYPDGISGRRTTAMAVIALGVPLITTSGRLTEALWSESEGVALTPASNPEALASFANYIFNDPDRLRALAEKGRALYHREFAVEHTVRRLREPVSASD